MNIKSWPSKLHSSQHSKECQHLSEKWWKIINFPTQNHLKHSKIQQVPPGIFSSSEQPELHIILCHWREKVKAQLLPCESREKMFSLFPISCLEIRVMPEGVPQAFSIKAARLSKTGRHRARKVRDISSGNSGASRGWRNWRTKSTWALQLWQEEKVLEAEVQVGRQSAGIWSDYGIGAGLVCLFWAGAFYD